MENNPKVYTDDEIEALLSGDRRIIDRLLLHAINQINAVIIRHMDTEEAIILGLGNAEKVRVRAAWVEAQIERQRVRTEMMRKVAQSATAYVVIGCLAFLAYAAWDSILAAIRARPR